MRFPETKSVDVVIRPEVFAAVFDECDRYDPAGVETGGRLLGTFRNVGGKLQIYITGMIDAGEQASRSRSHVFQDGDYQAQIFRSVEARQPNVEHLGTWHTHHVNGLQHLSAGDIKTYRRTVNHEKQNTDFWYALLVTERVSSRTRYRVRHYILHRGEDEVYEIPRNAVRIEEGPVSWVPGMNGMQTSGVEDSLEPVTNNHLSRRHLDNEVMQNLYPNLNTFSRKGTQDLYWRGSILLADGRPTDVLMLESESDSKTTYDAVVTGGSKDWLGPIKVEGHDRPWQALHLLEKLANRTLLEKLKLEATTSPQRRAFDIAQSLTRTLGRRK